MMYLVDLTYMYFGAQIVEHIVKRENIQSGNAASGEVLLARDTRPSGEALVSAARQVSIHCQCFPFRCGAKMNRQTDL
jgi:hypothetical protein